MQEKRTHFLILEKDGFYGIGECPTLPGLSIDYRPDFETKLDEVCEYINAGNKANALDISDFPSIQFGLDTALQDLEQKGNKILFPGNFAEGKEGIRINGLIWMGTKEFITDQIKEKIEAGSRCLKMKVGSLDFNAELEILSGIRKNYPNNTLEIRLDANGAFVPSEALEKLKILSDYNIHSIEQPIKPGQWHIMSRLCEKSLVPIALDEELIGIRNIAKMKYLLNELKPSYIILKPSLLGGFKIAEEWLKLTNSANTGWWITSALESNIGLNAIAQWTYSLHPALPQGLGTGKLYNNNIPSPLVIEGEYLYYKPGISWNLSSLIE
jgi:L-alanine-DL-glutamate epimerase and related enzymes of enolase superfamily